MVSLFGWLLAVIMLVCFLAGTCFGVVLIALLSANGGDDDR